MAWGVDAYKKTSGLVKETEAKAPLTEREFVKTVLKPAPPKESKYRKVATMLAGLSKEEARKILDTLDATQRALVTAELADMGRADLARPEAPRPFMFMDNFSVEQVQFLLYDETPATAALVLTHLAPKKAAAVLAASPGAAWKTEVALRIAKMGEISPEVLETVSEAFRKKAQGIGRQDGKDIELDGAGALAAILRAGDYSFGEEILGAIKNEDPDLGKTLKDRLWTLEDVVKTDDKRIAAKLRGMETRDIALLLRGAALAETGADAFKEKVLSNVSAGRRADIKEEDDIMGKVLRRDAEDALRAFMNWFQKGVETGEIVLG
jgi:flagellar motor switch protein FliG